MEIGKTRKKFWASGFTEKILTLVILSLIPLVFIGNDAYLGIIFLTFLWAGLGGAWNLLAGFAGQFSLGHVAFFGIGAYTSVLLNLNYSITPWIGMLVGGLIAGVIGGLLGLIFFRLRGHFFALGTLAFGQVVFMVAIAWRWLTSGSEGLLVPLTKGWLGLMFTDKLPYVYLSFLFMVLVVFITYFLKKSKLGYYLLAYRDSDDAARAVGINTVQVRVIVSVISAFLTAIGGGIFAQYLCYIDPNTVLNVTLAVKMALITIIGGLGYVFGPIVGSVIIIPLTELLRSHFGSVLPGLHYILYGVILIIVLKLSPEGVYPKFVNLFRDKFGGSDYATD